MNHAIYAHISIWNDGRDRYSIRAWDVNEADFIDRWMSESDMIVLVAPRLVEQLEKERKTNIGRRTHIETLRAMRLVDGVLDYDPEVVEAEIDRIMQYINAPEPERDPDAPQPLDIDDAFELFRAWQAAGCKWEE